MRTKLNLDDEALAAAQKAAPGKTKTTAGPGTATSTQTAASVMAELEALGTEPYRRTYRRHGAEEPMFGVSFAHLAAMKKKLKVDHPLAKALWETGNSDARSLATMLADPARLTPHEAERWVHGTRFHGLVDLVAGVVAQTPFAREKADAWRHEDDELVARAGWRVTGALARAGSTIPDAYFAERLDEIRKGISRAKNRTREGMNGALIGIGAGLLGLRKKAIETAKAIGPVEIDHGDTGCKTADAVAYIGKYAEREKRAGKGKAGAGR